LQVALDENRAEVTHEPLPQVFGDESQLVQLLQNLVANALKFRSEAAPRLQITARQEGEEWVICVRDNGIGIEPQYLHRIFIIFQRLYTRQEYPGTGIGLAICKRIVERHGGRIWAESTPGDGSAFCFTLPDHMEA
jgi:light-regulated signal transduction histidine kinase (bacteriophytochrome)